MVVTPRHRLRVLLGLASGVNRLMCAIVSPRDHLLILAKILVLLEHLLAEIHHIMHIGIHLILCIVVHLH